MNEFDHFNTDYIEVFNRRGERRGPFSCSIAEGKVYLTMDGIASEHFDENDTIERKLPNGRKEFYNVIDAVFHKSPFPEDIPHSWELRVEKVTAPGRPKPPKRVDSGASSINIENLHANNGVQIGNNNTMSIAALLAGVAKNIDEVDAPEVEKSEAKSLLGSVLSNPLLASALSGAVGAVITANS